MNFSGSPYSDTYVVITIKINMETQKIRASRVGTRDMKNGNRKSHYYCLRLVFKGTI